MSLQNNTDAKSDNDMCQSCKHETMKKLATLCKTMQSTMDDIQSLLRPNVQVPNKDVCGKSVYVLRCHQEKYYVGMTRKPVLDRFLEHIHHYVSKHETSAGSQWTLKYEPVEIVFHAPMKTIFDEDNTTLEYMIRYGIDNVRGGTFCSIQLPAHQRRTIVEQIATLKQLCFACGASGHFKSACPATLGVETKHMQ